MRITESSLRRLIRKMIQEAPLADLAPPRRATSRADGFSYDTDETNPAKADKIFASSGFKRKLQKLVGNWPQGVWVYPVTVESNADDRDRYYIEDPSRVMSGEWGDEGSQIFEIVSEWMEKSGGAGTLIVPYASDSNIAVELTPWMFLHALFDNDAYERYGFMKKAIVIRNTVMNATDELEIIAKALGMQNWMETIERIFTMGSARKKYVSNVIFQFADIGNEAAAQSLTTGGFRYNREAFEEIREVALQAGQYVESIDAIQRVFDRAEALSPAARQEFLAGINGKVVAINVT